MSRITGVIVALATTAAVLTGSTVGAAPPPVPADVPGVADLPRQIERGEELTLADGDLLRVWASENYRTVRARRRDVATGAWADPVVVLRKKNLFCGSVDVRTANGAVAVVAECDYGSYAVDQAPTASHALWSADTVGWTAYELEGEAYDEPGISPDGSRAVYPESEGYVTFGPEGFVRHRLETPGREYTATATITDESQVSYLYGSGLARRCRIVVLTRTGDAAPVRQELTPNSACEDTSFVNVDAHTTLFGYLPDPGQVAVISRAGAGSPWAVTQVAPADAPGLDVVERGLPTQFFAAPGGPLVAIGSARGHRIRAQLYDRSTQTWGASAVVHDAGRARCSWGDTMTADPLGVIAATVRCPRRSVVLTTGDGIAWQALRAGRHPLGISPDSQYVAVPGRSRSWVISAERGVVTLPGGVTGRCDVLVPDGPDGAVLLTAAGRHRGWPTVLQHSSAGGWSRLSRTNLPVKKGPCRRARAENWSQPYHFRVTGERFRGYSVRIVQRDDAWVVRRAVW
jgi:hypothetical protein